MTLIQRQCKRDNSSSVPPRDQNQESGISRTVRNITKEK